MTHFLNSDITRWESSRIICHLYQNRTFIITNIESFYGVWNFISTSSQLLNQQFVFLLAVDPSHRQLISPTWQGIMGPNDWGNVSVDPNLRPARRKTIQLLKVFQWFATPPPPPPHLLHVHARILSVLLLWLHAIYNANVSVTICYVFLHCYNNQILLQYFVLYSGTYNI